MRSKMRKFGVLASLAATAMVLLLGAAPRALAQEKEKATGDGIKVHGHWTIDVKNADGSLASHHEFENALTSDGAASLSRLLATPNTTVVGWTITVINNTGGLRTLTLGQGLDAVAADSPNLTVTAGGPPSVSGSGQQTVLQGSIQVPAAFSISEVDTFLDTNTQSAPDQPLLSSFSRRTLPQAIDVQSNQIVQITVVFSFS